MSQRLKPTSKSKLSFARTVLYKSEFLSTCANAEKVVNRIERIVKSFFIFLSFSFAVSFDKIEANVPALGEVASLGTDYFLLKIKFLAKCECEFTAKFAILSNAC